MREVLQEINYPSKKSAGPCIKATKLLVAALILLAKGVQDVVGHQP